MAWTYNDVRIYAQSKQGKQSQIISRLSPLDTATVLHRFGRNSEILNLKALVVTSGDLSSLQALIPAGTSAVLSGPEGVVGDYFLNSIQYNRTMTVNSRWTDRPDLDCDVPVYDVSLELYIDE